MSPLYLSYLHTKFKSQRFFRISKSTKRNNNLLLLLADKFDLLKFLLFFLTEGTQVFVNKFVDFTLFSFDDFFGGRVKVVPIEVADSFELDFLLRVYKVR